MTKSELDMLHQFSIHYYQEIASYMNDNTPGMTFFDRITDIIWLLASKNPDLHIKAAFDSSNSYSKYPVNLENFTEIIAPLLHINSNSKTNNTFFEFLLDPTIKKIHNSGAKVPIEKFKNIFARLNKTASVSGFFSLLWYSTLPCFDLRGITSNNGGQKALLRLCMWKGVDIPCSAIFTTFPTDKGMCCAFNMKAAEDIFLEGPYPKIVKQLQESDRNASFIDSTIPSWYKNKNEPKTLPGRNKNLS